MPCWPLLVSALSAFLAALGLLHLRWNSRRPIRYGKHEEEEEREGKDPAQGEEQEGEPRRRASGEGAHLPARCAWFLQELPAFLVPSLLLASRQPPRLAPLGCRMLMGMFCGHYFYRTFIYSFLTRGRPFPLKTLYFGMLFCTYNGFLQGYYMIYCAEYPDDWCNSLRFTSGSLLFLFGIGINIHSDHILRQLRKPGELTYKIPQGGLFAYISGANFFGEILEWFGYAVATWSLPAFAFALLHSAALGHVLTTTTGTMLRHSAATQDQEKP